MKERKKIDVGAKTGRIEEGQRRYGLGRETLRKVALEAGAVIRIGRVWLVNFSILDMYMDQLSGSGGRER